MPTKSYLRLLVWMVGALLILHIAFVGGLAWRVHQPQDIKIRSVAFVDEKGNVYDLGAPIQPTMQNILNSLP